MHTSDTIDKSTDPNSPHFAPWDDPTQKPLIEFRNVTKRYGDFVAIDNLSLKIYQNEFFALLGPSGCGKTTMMRMLAGFEAVTEGQILVDGTDISSVPPNERPINMMFQSYALFPHMTVEKNIAFGLKQEGRPKAEIQERVAEMLKLVQLDDFAKRRPEQLSGGQRQRVALARSLAKKPKVLLLDEPLGALDRKLREKTQFELVNLQERLGMTFMIVTHDQEEAMTVACRIAVMDKGELIQVDTPPQIYEAPKSRYVADFIGDVNFIQGRVRAHLDAEKLTLITETGSTITAIAPEGESVDIDAQIWVALRPEKVEIHKTEPQEVSNKIQGKIIDIAYVGNISTYYVQVADGTRIKAQRTNLNRVRNRGFNWEEEVWLSWREDAGVTLKR